MIDWSAVDHVLLDMDGTLLDLRYDLLARHAPTLPQTGGIVSGDALASLSRRPLRRRCLRRG